MITKIYHKKNELFQVEFYQDKKCQQAFDFENINFENIKNLYIELKDGDCTPILKLSNKLWSLNIGYLYGKANIFTPAWYLSLYAGITSQVSLITLNDVLNNIDLSKYILDGEDNAVLFLSEEEANKHSDNCESWFLYQKDFPTRLSNSEMDIRDWKAITIFLTHGTESELKKASEIAEELKKRYGIERIYIFVLHLFTKITEFYEKIVFYSDSCLSSNIEDWHNLGNINKIITTSSMPQVFQKRLQILDCYDIFNDYLKGE